MTVLAAFRDEAADDPRVPLIIDTSQVEPRRFSWVSLFRASVFELTGFLMSGSDADAHAKVGGG